jgi:hypothetical protein
MPVGRTRSDSFRHGQESALNWCLQNLKKPFVAGLPYRAGNGTNYNGEKESDFEIEKHTARSRTVGWNGPVNPGLWPSGVGEASTR